jgi:hypothetical protein
MTTEQGCPACAGAMPADQMGLPLQAEHQAHQQADPVVQVIAEVLKTVPGLRNCACASCQLAMRRRESEDAPSAIVAALRAAGLLSDPSKVTVDREALQRLIDAAAWALHFAGLGPRPVRPLNYPYALLPAELYAEMVTTAPSETPEGQR